MPRLLLLAVLLSLSACNANSPDSNDTADIRFVASEGLIESGFPLSDFVEADGWLFLSGTLGTTPDQKLVPGGIGPETRQTMENIKATLEAEGLGMDNVVKCMVMLADMEEWSTFNGIYEKFFDGTYPARSAFAAAGLAIGARVEVECIARR